MILSLAGLMVAQRQLLSAAGVRMPRRSVAIVVAVSTGLARLLPAGPATAATWQAGQYHRRGAGASAGVWAVLAGGLASLFVILVALVTGAAIAGTAGPWVLAVAFEVTGATVPWRGLLLACAAGQLGGRLVLLPGGLGGMEGGVLGALALAGTHPAAAAVAAVVVYRVAGYWAPGGAGTIVAAVLARRHPGPAATGRKGGDAHAHLHP